MTDTTGTGPGLPTPPRVFRPPQYGELIDYQGHLYQIGQIIGQGAFGAVYECTDDWFNPLVAKVMLPLNRPYGQVRDEWLRELDSLVLLRHPNITYVYDAFEYNDTFYLVIERCASTLADLLQTQGFDGTIWLPYLASDVLQAINFVHTNNYVHKDLHPGNVFIAHVHDKMVPTKEPVWQFKVGDLGISRLESDVDIFNTVLAQWMLPPEFLNPIEFGGIGRQVDIYHVGLLLLRMLVGYDLQFSNDEIVQGLPRQLAEQLTSPYSDCIAKALRRHVASRTQTPLELWREIVAASQTTV